MTQRENLMALLRQQPYEFVPTDLMLCPALEEEYHRRTGEKDLPYQDYFQLAWRRAPELIPDDTDVSRFFPIIRAVSIPL